MIARYSRPQMAALWTDEAQFRTWLDVEVLACEGWAKLGKIPADALKTIREKADFNTERVLEIERETKHDIAAFVSDVQSRLGDAGRFIHLGMTSSDVLDTAFSYRLKKSCELILQEIDNCLKTTKERALRDKLVPMMGRTHGIHAEPVTMGLKWLYWHDLLKRAKKRLEDAKKEISVAKISGAVGTYAHLPPEVERHVAESLGLTPDSLSTQVVSRDRYADYFAALGLLGSAVETIAVELRHLQRTEVGEVREGFSKGQKGSSAMPHKRNPISAENLTGLARLLRGMVIPAMENCALWHERDISHSSVERVIAPDANILSDYMMARLNTLLSNLETYPDRMKDNLDMLQGVIYSQKILLGLIDRGMSRDDAYEVVQRNALAAIDKKTPFRTLIKNDALVTQLISNERDLDEWLNKLFDFKQYIQHVEYIFKKVLG